MKGSAQEDLDALEASAAAGALDLAAWVRLWRVNAATLPAPRARRVLRVLRAMVEEGAAGPSVSLLVRLDATAEERAVAVLPEIQKTAPDADRAYILRGAVKVGLNRLCALQREYAAVDFTHKACEGSCVVKVSLEPDDVPRVAALAALHGVPVEHVVGAALSTGLAMLVGVDAHIEGPFSEV